jgi:hypothetical protein
MARTRAGKTSRLDSAAIAAGSALGSLAKRIDSLTARRAEITTQLQKLVGQAEGALRGLAGGRKAAPKKRTKAKARARKTRKART